MTHTLKTIPYSHYETNLPQEGAVILGQCQGEDLIVYQAFNKHIATYAVAKQQFGGAAYSFNRMTWIKPNFLWMMYRAGWATKANQEHILAIRMRMGGLIALLEAGVYSSYQARLYGSEANWKAALATSDVRIQWDPDHGPGGNKLTRRAIQIGIRGKTLHTFNSEWIVGIEDVTSFVVAQRPYLSGQLDQLQVIEESVISVPPTIKEKYEIIAG